MRYWSKLLADPDQIGLFLDENVHSWWITDQLFVYFGEHHKGTRAYLNAGQEVLTSIKLPFSVCYGYHNDGTNRSVMHGYL